MSDVPAVSRTHGPGLTPGGRLDERVNRLFAEAGPLARAFEGFEPRPGQQRLATAVAKTFSSGGTLVAEAGTGIGKTLAYLAPAILDGRRVLISTGTRTLQDQIFYKDLPALADAIGQTVRATYMKGRTNYLCRHRFERLQEAAAGLPHDERAWMERIGHWAAVTETGDRAEIEDLPDQLPLWNEITATSDQCLGRECPRFGDCFVTAMRERAAEAQLIVVNHHLLCADASLRQGEYGEVIPECDLAVIDEAHQLEDVVTQYFGVSLSAHRVDELTRDATSAMAATPLEDPRATENILSIADDVRQCGRRLFDLARVELARRESGDRVLLTPDASDYLRPAAAELAEALERFAAIVAAEREPPEEVRTVARRAAAMRADLDILLAAKDARYVHFLEGRGRGVSFRAAPIEVSDIIRDSVLAGRHANVLTSATLTVESSFDYVRGRLGLAQAATLKLPSEFDYTTQAVLYLPAGLPDPRSRDFNAAASEIITSLLERTRGRAFVLFTSYAALRDVHQRIESKVEWPLLVQGTAPRSALLRDFRATPNAVLLATSSFWQGVDVAGEALSCVIIDRLPFASPGDPIVAARIAAIQDRGGQPFHDYQVPLATLTLLQGLGRLIRTRRDRGVLAVLDPRLRQKAYGRRFLASLPPAPVTDDLEVVGRFFGQC